MESLICSFYLSVAALACCWDDKQPTNKTNTCDHLSVTHTAWHRQKQHLPLTPNLGLASQAARDYRDSRQLRNSRQLMRCSPVPAAEKTTARTAGYTASLDAVCSAEPTRGQKWKRWRLACRGFLQVDA